MDRVPTSNPVSNQQITSQVPEETDTTIQTGQSCRRPLEDSSLTSVISSPSGLKVNSNMAANSSMDESSSSSTTTSTSASATSSQHSSTSLTNGIHADTPSSSSSTSVSTSSSSSTTQSSYPSSESPLLVKAWLDSVRGTEVIAELMESVDALLVYASNLRNTPQDARYHRVCATNIHFNERLGHLPRSSDVMKAIGYSLENQVFVFNRDAVATSQAIDQTKAIMTETVEVLEREKRALLKAFLRLPDRTSHQGPCSVRGVGYSSDQGKRSTMEDDEVVIDDLLDDSYEVNVLNEALQADGPYTITTIPTNTNSTTNPTTDRNGNDTTESKTPTPEVISSIHPSTGTNTNNTDKSMTTTVLDSTRVREMLGRYGYFGLYDGHGGRETVDFVVRMLHVNLRRTLVQQVEWIVEGRQDKDNKNYYDNSKSDTSGDRGKTKSNQIDNKDKDTTEPGSVNNKDMNGKDMMDVLTDDDVVWCLRQAYLRTDGQLRRGGILRSGTTSVTCLVRHKSDGAKVLYIANVGDSRAVLSMRPGSVSRLTLDHKASDPDEAKRIREAGGFVTANNRVNGVLAITRALGDHALKERPLVLAQPHLAMVRLPPQAFKGKTTTQTNTNANTETSERGASSSNNGTTDTTTTATTNTNSNTRLTEVPPFLILACDGLWDVITDERAVDYVYGVIGKHINSERGVVDNHSHQKGKDHAGLAGEAGNKDKTENSNNKNKNNNKNTTTEPYTLNEVLSEVSRGLIDEALRCQTTDNVTVMVIAI